MPAIIDQNECTGCELCIDECPAEAIILNDEGKAFVDSNECTECEICIDICPNVAISI